MTLARVLLIAETTSSQVEEFVEFSECLERSLERQLSRIESVRATLLGASPPDQGHAQRLATVLREAHEALEGE